MNQRLIVRVEPFFDLAKGTPHLGPGVSSVPCSTGPTLYGWGGFRFPAAQPRLRPGPAAGEPSGGAGHRSIAMTFGPFGSWIVVAVPSCRTSQPSGTNIRNRPGSW